jgi:formylmethanofuran dehydrogenase subunit E
MNDTWVKVQPKHNELIELVAIQYTGANEAAVHQMFCDHSKPLMEFEIQKTIGYSFVNNQVKPYAHTAVETENAVCKKCSEQVKFSDYIVLDAENGTFEVYTDLDFARKFMPAD